MATAVPMGRAAAPCMTPSKSSEPKFQNIRNIAIRKPKSPILLTMNAFLPASALAFSVNQKLIRK